MPAVPRPSCCEYLSLLTAQYSYASLDQCLVDLVAELLTCGAAELFIGVCEEVEGSLDDSDQCQWLALSRGAKDLACRQQPTVWPVLLHSGQRLSLLFVAQPDEVQRVELGLLLSVYCNQYRHLDQSHKDSLTGLKNRRAFDSEYLALMQMLAPVMAGAREEEGLPRYYLAVLDIDWFKQVNDQCGHLVGDETLIAFSNLMKGFFRRVDRLYRFGGEEFVVLLEAASVAAVERLLNKLRQQIADYHFSQVGHKTVSIGYVELAALNASSLLFEQADAALYYAKEHGRNRVEGYDTLVTRGEIPLLFPREGEVELF